MDREKLTTGYIFDIQGFSVHDGPGCRTLIFLKGCSLHCRWCSNPEGINPFPELLYHRDKCSGDGHCILACHSAAITPADEGVCIDRGGCCTCSDMPCVSACIGEAMTTVGRQVTTEELFRVINRDRNYWGSEGGITLTGGEPMLQASFATALLERCYEAYIHTAIETCGNVPWSAYQAALPYLDLILFDIKHMDPAKHQAWTGTSNRLILDNARALARECKEKLRFRVPLVPGFNDGEENLAALGLFAEECGGIDIELLPLHHLGREKYTLLGRSYSMDPSKLPSPSHLRQCYVSLNHARAAFRQMQPDLPT